jgi:uncharacterized protein YuzE
MKINYFSNVDQLAIIFSDRKSALTKEVAPGVVLDWDGRGNLVAIDIEHASRKMDVSSLELNDQPVVPFDPRLSRNPFRQLRAEPARRPAERKTWRSRSLAASSK